MSVLVLPLSRILLSLVFIFAGYGKVFGGMDAFKGYVSGLIQKSPFPQLGQYSDILAQVGAYVEFGGGILLFIGLLSRVAALGLLVFTLLATLLAHNFWAFTEAQAIAQQTSQFLKNMGIIGGLLIIVGAGGGALGIDGMFRRAQ
jgi:putative oxidoreductase